MTTFLQINNEAGSCITGALDIDNIVQLRILDSINEETAELSLTKAQANALASWIIEATNPIQNPKVMR